jgi:hypothetical protein
MATLTTATNSLTKAAQHLHDSLANSAQFQTLTSAANSTQAATHIYLDALPRPDSMNYVRAEIEKLRPFALINTESYHASLEAPPSGFGHSGVLALRLFRSVADEIASKPGEIGRRFDNTLGTLLAELEAQCGTAGRLAFNDYDMSEPWGRTSDEEEEDFGDSLKALITFSWSGL